MMSDSYCEAKACDEGPLCEPESCYSETPQGKDLKRWLRILRWFGWKPESKDKPLVKERTEEAKWNEKHAYEIRQAREEILPWDWGWDAMAREIGRCHFNIGPICRYSKWSIGITEQQYDRDSLKDTKWHNSVAATQILPFDEVHTGRPSVMLL